MFNLFNILVICLAITTNPKYPLCNECVKMKTEQTSVFLESLTGKWQGHAIRTPIGKVSYDLRIKTLEKNKIKGTSYTNGQAIHTWIFELGSEDQLILDFHSTLGDSWAKGLCVTKLDKNKGYLFTNGEPSHLKVWVNNTVKDKIQIEIFLRDKPHVSIVTSKVKP